MGWVSEQILYIWACTLSVTIWLHKKEEFVYADLKKWNAAEVDSPDLVKSGVALGVNMDVSVNVCVGVGVGVGVGLQVTPPGLGVH